MALDSAELYAAVAQVVGDIPPGNVMSYGDVAAIIGTGPRQVGKVMSTGVLNVPWWRVTRADGTLPEPLRARARREYAREGTPLTANGVQIARCRWRP